MQRELALILRNQRDETRVMRARRDFREPDLVALDEQFDTEDAPAAKRGGDFAGHVARFRERNLAHRLRLPGLDIVAVELDMADGLAEMRAVGGAHREQSDFEVEADF